MCRDLSAGSTWSMAAISWVKRSNPTMPLIVQGLPLAADWLQRLPIRWPHPLPLID